MSSRGKVLAFGAVALFVGVLGFALAGYFISAAKEEEETKRPLKTNQSKAVSSNTKLSEKAKQRVASIKDTELPKKSCEYFVKNEKDEQEVVWTVIHCNLSSSRSPLR
jgi:Flp pilus assembly protein TadB